MPDNPYAAVLEAIDVITAWMADRRDALARCDPSPVEAAVAPAAPHPAADADT